MRTLTAPSPPFTRRFTRNKPAENDSRRGLQAHGRLLLRNGKDVEGWRRRRIRAAFDCPIETVWAVVTSLGDISWRSDITGIDIPEPGKTFVEHTPDGTATTFTITAFEPARGMPSIWKTAI